MSPTNQKSQIQSASQAPIKQTNPKKILKSGSDIKQFLDSSDFKTVRKVKSKHLLHELFRKENDIFISSNSNFKVSIMSKIFIYRRFSKIYWTHIVCDILIHKPNGFTE